jgi:multiple sugar transport system permease protein
MAVAVTEVWRATAIVMVILVAGLQMIHKDYMDTADVFGASRLQKLRYVILPLLKPSIQTALIIRTVLAFQMFAPVLILTGGTLPVLAFEAYRVQFFMRDFHLASAYGIVMMTISTIFVLLYLRLLRTKWVML